MVLNHNAWVTEDHVGQVQPCSLGQASPSLETPRLHALETRGLFHQKNRKGKIVMTKTSRYKGLVLGSFLAPEIDMIFGDGVGPPLYCSNQQPSVTETALEGAQKPSKKNSWIGSQRKMYIFYGHFFTFLTKQ